MNNEYENAGAITGFTVTAAPPLFAPLASSFRTQGASPLIGSLVGTLTIASAVSIGSNWVDVGNGAMSPGQAVLNGMAKGAAATLILKATTRSTPLQIVLAAAVLAGSGYLIDSTMKKNKNELCAVNERVEE